MKPGYEIVSGLRGVVGVVMKFYGFNVIISLEPETNLKTPQ